MGCRDGYYIAELYSDDFTFFSILTYSHLHLGYQRLTTPTPLSSVSPGGICKEKEFCCENSCCVPADALSIVCDNVNDCGDEFDEK